MSVCYMPRVPADEGGDADDGRAPTDPYPYRYRWVPGSFILSSRLGVEY